MVTGGGRPVGSEVPLPAGRLSVRESERPGRVPGQLIAGRFRVIQALGAGSLGAVYLCVETATAKTVAVKVFRRDLAKDPEFSDALRIQAARAIALGERHDGIVRVHECGRSSDGTLFVVMECVQRPKPRGHHPRRRPPGGPANLAPVRSGGLGAGGGARDGRGARGSPAAPGDGRRLGGRGGRQAEGVRGIRRQRDRPGGPLAPRRNRSRRFPEYTAPEEIEGDVVTPRTDIYALGVMLFEMLSGAAPFRGTTPDGVLARHLQDTAAPVDSLRTDIPAVVALRVSQALEKEPEKRQRYVGDVINEYLFDLAVDELLEAAARNRPWAVRKMSAAVQACRPRASEDGEERTVGRIVLKTLAGAAVATAVLAPLVWIASPFWLPVFRTTASVGSTVTDARDAERGGGSGPVSPSIPTIPADAPVETVEADSTPAQTPDEVREQKRSATVRARQDGRMSSTRERDRGRSRAHEGCSTAECATDGSTADLRRRGAKRPARPIRR